MEYTPWKPWTFVAGVRYDDNSRYEDVWNPRVAVLFKPSEQWHLRASWGKTYLAPSPHLAYDRWGDLYEGAYLGLANEDLKPERTDNFEASADWMPNPNLLLRTAAFYIRGRELLGNEPAEATIIEGYNVYGTRTFNVSRSDIYGGQAMADWKIYDWLRLDGHYTFTKGRQEVGEERFDLPRMPRHLAQGHVTIDYADWTCRFSGNWFDHVSTGIGNSLHAGDSISGRFTLDAYLSRRFHIGPATGSIGLQVANMFDQKVYKVSAHDDFFAAMPEVPQERRRIFLTASVEF